MTLKSLGLIAAVAVVGLPGSGLKAGGWTVITLQNPATQAHAGTPITYAYTIRQHGHTPMNGLSGRLEARKGPTLIRVSTRRVPVDGTYTATLMLPEPGAWQVELMGGSGLVGDKVAWTIDVVARGASHQALSDEARGRLLFESKGCVMCHQHDAFAGRQSINLVSFSGRQFTPGFVETFLRSIQASPSNIDSYGKMPDLGLVDHEIDALAAFLGR